MRKVIIEAAVNGNAMRDRNPHVPWTPQEIASDAISAANAGAAVIHFHVRDPQTGAWVQDVPYYAEATRTIRASCDALLWPTMPYGDDVIVRYEHIYALAADPATRPDFGPCDPGTVNRALYDPQTRKLRNERIYSNPYEHNVYMLKACRELGLRPMLQIFDPSFLRAVLVFLEQGLLTEPLSLKLYLGARVNPVGLPPARESLEMYLYMLRGVCCNWFAGTVGGDVTPLIPDIVQLGGHLRVGFEDYLHADGDRPLKNAEIVERAAAEVRRLGYGVAAGAEAREMLEA